MFKCLYIHVILQWFSGEWHNKNDQYTRATLNAVKSKWWPNYFEGPSQWPPFQSIPAKDIQGCMFGANLVIVAQICDHLWCGQCIWSQNGLNDLEGQGHWPRFFNTIHGLFMRCSAKDFQSNWVHRANHWWTTTLATENSFYRSRVYICQIASTIHSHHTCTFRLW